MKNSFKNKNKTTNPVENWAEYVKGQRKEQETRINNEHMERCFTLLILRGMHTLTRVINHLIPTELSKIKILSGSGMWRNINSHAMGCGECILVLPPWKAIWQCRLIVGVCLFLRPCLWKFHYLSVP